MPKIILKLPNAKEDGIIFEDDIVIKQSNPLLKINTDKSYKNKKVYKPYSYNTEYSISVPVYIADAVKGLTINHSNYIYRGSDKQTLRNTNNIIKMNTLEYVVTCWVKLINDYSQVIRDTKAQSQPKEKIIFFKIKTNSFSKPNDFKESEYSNNSYTKEKIVSYIYDIGYKNAFGYYNKDEKYIGKEIIGYKIIDYSEENLAFFQSIDNAFDALMERLETLNSKIDNENIKKLIITHKHLFLGQGN